MQILDHENDCSTLARRAHYGLETKNKLVSKLREEVDLFMMTPECMPALCHLDALKEQLAFHYHRITQHVVSFADSRLRTLPVGGPPSQALCISTWAQCVGYELICELLDSLIKEVDNLRSDCVYDAAQSMVSRQQETAAGDNDGESVESGDEGGGGGGGEVGGGGGGFSRSGVSSGSSVQQSQGSRSHVGEDTFQSRSGGEASFMFQQQNPDPSAAAFLLDSPMPSQGARREFRTWNHDFLPSSISEIGSGMFPQHFPDSSVFGQMDEQENGVSTEEQVTEPPHNLNNSKMTSSFFPRDAAAAF